MGRKNKFQSVMIKVCLACFVWMIINISGARLPYIYTDFSTICRALIIFPILFSTSFYIIFIHRFKGYKVSPHRLSLERYSSTKEKVKDTLFTLFSLGCIAAFFAYFSINISVWITKLTATDTYSESFIIDGVKDRGSTGVDLFLSKTDKSEKVILHLSNSRYRENNWRRYERICVKGRTSMFGTIIDHENRCSK